MYLPKGVTGPSAHTESAAAGGPGLVARSLESGLSSWVVTRLIWVAQGLALHPAMANFDLTRAPGLQASPLLNLHIFKL